MIEYYASLINYYSAYKLKKLMSSFVYYVNKYKNAAKEFAKQSVYETKQKLNKNVSIKLPKAEYVNLYMSFSKQQLNKSMECGELIEVKPND